MEEKTAGGDEPVATTNVKQEKIDPEIEEKIKLLKTRIKQETRESVEKQKETKNDESKANGSDTPTTNEDASEDEEEGEEEDDENEDDENEEDANDEETTNKQPDDKKNIEPVKSSNEILAELFKVFNAEPPKELLNDKELIEKTHRKKKHKKEKKKKRKKSKSPAEKSDADEDLAASDALSKTNGSKHKKKKKHKHKDEKEREKSRERHKHEEKHRTKEEAANKEKRHRERESEGESEHNKRKYKDHKREEKPQHKVRREEPQKQGDKEKLTITVSNDRTKRDSEEKPKNSFYNGFKEELQIKKENGQKHRKSTRSRSHETISDISLSDEETYLKEKQQMHSEPKQARLDKVKEEPLKTTRSSSYSRSQNSFYAGAEETLSRDKDRDKRYHRSENKRYHRSRTRSRSKSRSRSRSRDLGIDKKRLLEIARKNAISMFKRGNLPGSANMSEEIRDKVLLKMRYGGRTVQDLTDFCKKISNGENLSDLSSDEDSDVDKQGNAKAFHHPFQVKEREPIVMHIRNAIPKVPRPPAGAEQTKAITMQFPVSSGQHHRLTESAWVPVDPREKLAPLPPLPPVQQATTIFKNATTTKNVFEKPIPKQGQQEPAFKAVGVANEVPATQPPPAQATAVSNAVVPVTAAPVAPPPAQLPPAADLPNLTVPPPVLPAQAPVAPPPVFVPDVPIPSTAPPPQQPPYQEASIFPDQSQNNYDVASIITKRLNAMRRLQENPTDSEAIKLMYNSQREMTSWASSKHMPGQFTGSTGAKVLTAQELNSGPQVWVRRNQMTNTKPVSGGMGMHLLQKMGWKPGEGLGRAKTGQLQPLLLDVKLDKRGLVSKEDLSRNFPLPPQLQVNQQQHHLPNPMQHQQQYPLQNQHNSLQHPMQQHPLHQLQQPMRPKRPMPLPQESVQNKHPVSVLNEMCSKNRWNPPMYRVVNEEGPMHQKMFLFSVTMNGKTYTPQRGSTTKKEAKMIAARYCLQEMGLLPRDQAPNMPT